jgi:3',5'-cyclic-AMP phosphodiesterase
MNDSADNSMLIAQISDPHIRPAGELYKGVVDSNHLLLAAIEHLNAFDRKPDLVLLTGDLVDYGQPDEYANAVRLLGTLTIPYLVMPGNHDQRGALRQAFSSHAYLPKQGPMHFCIDEHPVRIVALDSTVPGKHHGHLDSRALTWLQATLAADRVKPTIVVLHHPPFVSGIGYLDEYNYGDHNALKPVLSAFDNIEAVLCGHVHRSMVKRWAGTLVYACPSTATQIALQLAPQAQPKSYVGPSACLLHLWTPADGLVSHTSYIGDYPGPYPFY